MSRLRFDRHRGDECGRVVDAEREALCRLFEVSLRRLCARHLGGLFAPFRRGGVRIVLAAEILPHLQMLVVNYARRLVEREVGVALAQISAHGRGIRAVIDGDVFAAARLVGGAARREAVPLNIITDVIPVIVPSLFIFPISPKC